MEPLLGDKNCLFAISCSIYLAGVAGCKTVVILEIGIFESELYRKEGRGFEREVE